MLHLNIMAIINFTHKGLRRLYLDDDQKGVPPVIADKLRRMLGALDAASAVDDMDMYPGWRLHALKGDLKGYWSITVTGNWRLIFCWNNGDASHLDLVDYH